MSMTLAEKVQAARRAKGWGTRELARRAGITPQNIDHIEKAITLDPRLSTIVALARALDKPLEYFADC